MGGPIAFLIAVLGGVTQRQKHPAWRTTGVATLALLLPFIGQLLRTFFDMGGTA